MDISQTKSCYVVMCVGRADGELDDGDWTTKNFFERERDAVAAAKAEASDCNPLNAVVFRVTPIMKAYRGKIRTKRIFAEDDAQ